MYRVAAACPQPPAGCAEGGGHPQILKVEPLLGFVQKRLTARARWSFLATRHCLLFVSKRELRGQTLLVK